MSALHTITEANRIRTSINFIVKKRDESGKVTHVLCTVRSISDSKRREENLNFAAEAAKREAEMKTRFLATMYWI